MADDLTYELRFVGDEQLLVQAAQNAERAVQRSARVMEDAMKRAGAAAKQIALPFNERQLALPVAGFRQIKGAVAEAGQGVEEYAKRLGEADVQGTRLYTGSGRNLIRSFRLAAYQLSGELNPALAQTIFALDRAALAAQLTGGSIGLIAGGAALAGVGLAALFAHFRKLREEQERVDKVMRSMNIGAIATEVEKLAEKIDKLAKKRAEYEKFAAVPTTGGWETVLQARAGRYQRQIEAEGPEMERRREAWLTRRRAENVPGALDERLSPVEQAQYELRLMPLRLQARQRLAEAENAVGAAMQSRLQAEGSLLAMQLGGAGRPGTEEVLRRQIEALGLQAAALRRSAAVERDAPAANVAKINTRLREQLETLRLQGALLREQQRQAQIAWRWQLVTPGQRRVAAAWEGEGAAERAALESRPLMALNTTRQVMAAVRSMEIELIQDPGQRAMAQLADRYRDLGHAIQQFGSEVTPELLARFRQLTAIQQWMLSTELREQPAGLGGAPGAEELLGAEGARRHRRLMSVYQQAQGVGVHPGRAQAEAVASRRGEQERLQFMVANAGDLGLKTGEQLAMGLQLGAIQIEAQLGTMAERMAEVMTFAGHNMVRGLDDAFFAVITGRFNTLPQIAAQVGLAMVRQMTNALAQSAVAGMMPGMRGGGGGFGAGGLAGGLFGLIGSLFGGGAAAAAPVGMASWAYMQHGGVVKRPTLAMLGEGGPEAVIPLDQAGGEGKLGGVSIINLSDPDQLSAVVAQEMARGREVIVNDVLQGLRGNNQLRRGMQRYMTR